MMSLRHKGLNSALPLKRQARKRVGVAGRGGVGGGKGLLVRDGLNSSGKKSTGICSQKQRQE